MDVTTVRPRGEPGADRRIRVAVDARAGFGRVFPTPLTARIPSDNVAFRRCRS